MDNEATDSILQPESYPMVGGDSDHSYANNSSYQRGVADAAKEMISNAISDKLDLQSLGFNTFTSNTFQLADMGCSIGPNTFIAVQNIIEAVECKLKHESANSEHQNPNFSLEFQVFFNDHSNNDFNTLFNALPPTRKYFAAGVPGSFHGRLFPKSKLHFVYSSYALQWLSKIPKEIADRKSPAWNKDSIQCTGPVKEVDKAYSAQFKNDTEFFLNARAQELVPGGLMAIVLPGLPNGTPVSETNVGQFYDFMRSCLIDVAQMGLFDEAKVESFNIPLHYPTSEELQAIIQRNGWFTIERMKILTSPPEPLLISKFSAESYTSEIRTIFEGVITKHFGSGSVEQIFNHFTTKLIENSFTFGEIKDYELVNLLIVLKRVV